MLGWSLRYACSHPPPLPVYDMSHQNRMTYNPKVEHLFASHIIPPTCFFSYLSPPLLANLATAGECDGGSSQFHQAEAAGGLKLLPMPEWMWPVHGYVTRHTQESWKTWALLFSLPSWQALPSPLFFFQSLWRLLYTQQSHWFKFAAHFPQSTFKVPIFLWWVYSAFSQCLLLLGACTEV